MKSRRHTTGLGGGFAVTASFLGAGASSSFGGCFVAGFLEGAAAGALGGAGPPALHLTVTFSKASLILDFRKSAMLSMVALSGRSPTIFMRVPKQVAASLRAPSKLSSNNKAKVSANGFTCAGGIGVLDEARALPKNFKVPSFT